MVAAAAWWPPAHSALGLHLHLFSISPLSTSTEGTGPYLVDAAQRPNAIAHIVGGGRVQAGGDLVGKEHLHGGHNHLACMVRQQQKKQLMSPPHTHTKLSSANSTFMRHNHRACMARGPASMKQIDIKQTNILRKQFFSSAPRQEVPCRAGAIPPARLPRTSSAAAASIRIYVLCLRLLRTSGRDVEFMFSPRPEARAWAKEKEPQAQLSPAPNPPKNKATRMGKV